MRNGRKRMRDRWIGRKGVKGSEKERGRESERERKREWGERLKEGECERERERWVET